MPNWTEAEIGIVGGLADRFSQVPVLHWAALRECIDSIRAMLRDLNVRMGDIEGNTDLSPNGRARQLTDAASSALSKLENYQPLTKAMQLAEGRITALKEKTTPLPKTPATAAEIVIASDIRRHIAGQENPSHAAWKLSSDPRVIAAILQAPSFLSGLTDEDVANIRNAAVKAAHPDQVREIAEIENALRVCQKAIASAQRKIAQRANMRRDADGIWRAFISAVPKAA